MADEPTKPLDRARPFKRINNDDFLPKNKTQPNGEGLPCGCNKPQDFGALGDKVVDALRKAFPPFNDFLNIVRKIGNTIADIQAIINPATQVIKFLRFIPIPGFNQVIQVASLALSTINDIVNAIKGFTDTLEKRLGQALDDALKKFSRRFLAVAVRHVPRWEPVNADAANNQVTPDQTIEVEGLVTRSYVEPICSPFFQWQRWLNWTVHIEPEDDYKNVLASGVSEPPDKANATAGRKPIIKDGTIECQWDTGVLWGDAGKRQAFETGFPLAQVGTHDGPMTQAGAAQLQPDDPYWIWPMKGQFAWTAGRWVYECAHASEDTPQKMCTMLNPLRAIATARWGAFKFPENDFAVPAIQFMFFACKRGGYIDHAEINLQDYEFIVDLPKVSAPEAPFPIGSEPKFDHNTIVVRPVLLKFFSDKGFGAARAFDPIVTPILSKDDPKKPPQQVKVKIPLSKLTGDSYGVTISLGWSDPTHELAATVRQCTLSLDQFDGRHQIRDGGLKEILDFFDEELRKEQQAIAGDLAKVLTNILTGPTVPNIPVVKDILNQLISNVQIMVQQAVNEILDELRQAMIKAFAVGVETEEWLLRVGVNGVWQSEFFSGVNTGQPKKFSRQPYTFFVGPEDNVAVCVNGIEFDPVGDLMLHPRAKRNFHTRVDLKDTADWAQHIANRNLPANSKSDLILEYFTRILTDVPPGDTVPAFGFNNSPLGLIEPSDTAGTGTTSNPLAIQGLAVPFNNKIIQTAQFASVPFQNPKSNSKDQDSTQGDPFILVEENLTDYHISYTLQIDQQKLDDGT